MATTKHNKGGLCSQKERGYLDREMISTEIGWLSQTDARSSQARWVSLCS